MSQRANAPRDRATVRRTLSWFWWVTKKKPFATFMAVFTSVAYTALLTYATGQLEVGHLWFVESLLLFSLLLLSLHNIFRL